MCKAYLADGSQCPCKPNAKYGNQYCGKHAKVYYEDIMKQKLTANIDDIKAQMVSTSDITQVKKLNNKLSKTIKEINALKP